jgi:hypothetical protein
MKMNPTNESLIRIISQCADTCDYCAAACLQEDNVAKMVICIRLNMECYSMCKTTAMLLQLGSEHAAAACQLCADICSACADECEKYQYVHCQECATVCRQCAEECICISPA